MVAELEHPLHLEDPRDRKAYFTSMTLFRHIATPAAIGALALFAEVHVTGAEKIPGTGPVVLAANHVTNFDVVPLQQAVNPRPIFFMGKEELYRNPIADWVFRHMGSFPVYRGHADEWAMRHAEKVLQKGLVLGIFPEGTRSKGKGLKSAKSGAARLAIAEGCPIVPAAVHGPQELFKKFPTRTRVEITIGDPIYPRPGESPLALSDRMMFTLAEMLPASQRGVYAVRPKGF